MEKRELVLALRQLDTLARAEYHASLAEVASRPVESEELRLLQIGRLLGVTLKEPFASSKALKVPSEFTGAYREWLLKPGAFAKPQTQRSWHYRSLEALRSDPDVIQSLGWKAQSVLELAETAQGERGFFWYLAMSCRKYLCKDPKLRSKIKREVEAAKRAGLNLKNITPEIIVASGGLTIGTILVQAIPILGVMGAPVIGALVLIIYTIGLDAFCQWATAHESYHANFPNADEEK